MDSTRTCNRTKQRRALAVLLLKDVKSRSVIITNNGRKFIRKNTLEYCEKFNTQIRFSSVSHPQTNGQVQSANKEILNGNKIRVKRNIG